MKPFVLNGHGRLVFPANFLGRVTRKVVLLLVMGGFEWLWAGRELF